MIVWSWFTEGACDRFVGKWLAHDRCSFVIDRCCITFKMFVIADWHVVVTCVHDTLTTLRCLYICRVLNRESRLLASVDQLFEVVFLVFLRKCSSEFTITECLKPWLVSCSCWFRCWAPLNRLLRRFLVFDKQPVYSFLVSVLGAWLR